MPTASSFLSIPSSTMRSICSTSRAGSKAGMSGAVRLKGYSVDEILGQHFGRFYTPEDQAAGVPALALKTARETGRFHAEGWRVRKDGTRFWALVVIDAIRDEAGKLVGYAKVTRDITEQRAATQALLESEGRYRRLIEAVVDYAIFQLDRRRLRHDLECRRATHQGLHAEEEIVGQHFSRFYTEKIAAETFRNWHCRQAETAGQFEAEGWRVRKDGSKFWALVVIDPIRDEAGNLIGFAKVTRDITERHEAQRIAAGDPGPACRIAEDGSDRPAERRHRSRLQQPPDDRDRQSGNRAASSRPSRQLTRVCNRVLTNAMRGAQRAAALTSRLLAFSRRQALDPKPLDVNKFLVGAVDFCSARSARTSRSRPSARAGLWHDRGRPEPSGVGARQSRHQCARRNAERRQADRSRAPTSLPTRTTAAQPRNRRRANTSASASRTPASA